METSTSTNVEAVTMSELLEVASWDRPRTSAELLSFIERREEAIDRF